eukprot:12654-Heterococcus_DN1.PRE.1
MTALLCVAHTRAAAAAAAAAAKAVVSLQVSRVGHTSWHLQKRTGGRLHRSPCTAVQMASSLPEHALQPISGAWFASGGLLISCRAQAMLSSPADLSSLVTLSQKHPEEFFKDDTLHVMVSKLLNSSNAARSDKDTKLDILAIMANLAADDSQTSRAREEIRVALMGVSEWFDAYMEAEESGDSQEPELHKAMLLLLARAWDYRIKTEDLLELTRGDRRLALETVVGVLEDGETYSTELVQRQKPSTGKVAQWEHELVCRHHEKAMLLQLCRLVRGFTHPTTYFSEHSNRAVAAATATTSSSSTKRDSSSSSSNEGLALYSVDAFSGEMDALLAIALRTRVLEKLSMSLYDCLFAAEDERLANGSSRSDECSDGDTEQEVMLEEADHQSAVLAVMCIHCTVVPGIDVSWRCMHQRNCGGV